MKYNSETLKRWQCPKYRDCYCWFGEWFLIFSICSFKLASPKRSWTLNYLHIATGFEYFSSCSRNLYTATWAPRLFSCIIPGAILIGVEKWYVFACLLSHHFFLPLTISTSLTLFPSPSLLLHTYECIHTLYLCYYSYPQLSKWIVTFMFYISWSNIKIMLLLLNYHSLICFGNIMNSQL